MARATPRAFKVDTICRNKSKQNKMAHAVHPKSRTYPRPPTLPVSAGMPELLSYFDPRTDGTLRQKEVSVCINIYSYACMHACGYVGMHVGTRARGARALSHPPSPTLADRLTSSPTLAQLRPPSPPPISQVQQTLAGHEPTLAHPRTPALAQPLSNLAPPDIAGAEDARWNRAHLHPTAPALAPRSRTRRLLLAGAANARGARAGPLGSPAEAAGLRPRLHRPATGVK